MEVFGWFLFVIGSLMLLFFAFVGLEGGITNLAGDIAGMALMVSGAVFIVGGRLETILERTDQKTDSGVQDASNSKLEQTSTDDTVLDQTSTSKKITEEKTSYLFDNIVIILVVCLMALIVWFL